MSDGGNAIEMQPRERPMSNRQRSVSGSNAEIPGPSKTTGNSMKDPNLESGMRRSNTTGRGVGEGLKRRFGSMRRSKKTTEV